MRELDDIIPASVSIHNHVIPLREIGRTLVLAIDESVSTDTRERIAFILNRTLRFVVATALIVMSLIHAVIVSIQPVSVVVVSFQRLGSGIPITVTAIASLRRSLLV